MRNKMDDENKTTEEENKPSEEKKKSEAEENKPSGEDEIVVTIDEGEKKEPDEPGLIKHLRQVARGQTKKIRQLNARLDKQNAENLPAAPGPKPTYESSGFKEDVFTEQLQKWHEKNNEYVNQKVVEDKKQKTQDDDWNKKLDDYNEKKTALIPRLKGFKEAEALSLETLNKNQQGLVVKLAKDPALVMYFLGKNPDQLEKLSGEKDIARFIRDMTQLEAQLKMETKKPTTQPEKKVTGATGSVSNSGGEDEQLDKLRAEAEKTGDLSKVVAYKRQKQATG